MNRFVPQMKNLHACNNNYFGLIDWFSKKGRDKSYQRGFCRVSIRFLEGFLSLARAFQKFQEFHGTSKSDR